MKRILFLMVLLVLFSGFATWSHAAERNYLGAILPGGAREVDTGRFDTSWEFGFLVKWYKKQYRGIDWITYQKLLNIPGVKAVHFKSMNPSTKWEGINIYQIQNKVRIYVIPREPPAAGPGKPEKEAKDKAGK